MTRAGLPLFVAALSTLLPLTAQAQLTYPPRLTADAGATDTPLAHAGYLDATLYGADRSGVLDSTAAIQAAIDDGMKYGMVTYLPVGTYLVSAPIVGEQIYDQSGCQTSVRWGSESVSQSPTLVGPASGPRPLLQLKASSPAFQDADNPVAVVRFYNDGPYADQPAWSGASDCQMFTVIRDLDVSLGTGNPGAIGIENPGTQGAYLENVRVDATGGYAGIQGTPNAAELAVNLEVDGGQYGIIPFFPTTLVGVTVKNQTVAGLKVDNFASLAVVGFEVDEPAGTAAVMNTWYPSQRSQVALIDGTITISGAPASAAIQNPNGHDLYIENVFVSTSGPLIQSGAAAAIPSAGAVSQISQYVFTNPTQDDESGELENSTTLIDGSASTAVIHTLASAPATPTDLVLRHLPGQLPWITDPGVIDVTTLGADPTFTTDSTAAIQKAIDEGDEVFLPRGIYMISGTLTLKPSTRLFGVPASLSELWASPSWDPGGHYVPFIQTANTATGATYVGDIFIQLPNATLAQSYLTALDWQAGRSSIVRQVYPRLPWKECPSGGCFVEPARDVVHVENNGGGRWYGMQLSQNDPGNFDPNMREILVDDTTAPLTFYAPNPEHTSGPMVEIRGAANVRIVGTKVEGTYGLIQGSTNVEVAAYTGHNTAGPGQSEWIVADANDVAIAASADWAGGLGTNPAGYLISETAGDGGVLAGIRDNDNCSLFAIGRFDPSPFPHCGDGTCDGAETTLSCPTDCTTAPGAGLEAGVTERDAGPGADAGARVLAADAAPRSGATPESDAEGDTPQSSGAGCALAAGPGARDATQAWVLVCVVAGAVLGRRRPSTRRA